MMKVGVVGAGLVGSTAAYAIGMTGSAEEVVLIDMDAARAQAEAEDISHAMPFGGPCTVRAGTYEALNEADIVVLSAGVAQKPGESRLDLLQRNADVFAQILGNLPKGLDPILLVATNPVDIMTTLALRLSGFPPHRVIGSGTILDTARFRALLSRHLGLSPGSIHAYVLGEHGDSEVLGWSAARVGTMPLEAYAIQINAPITDDVRAQIDAGVRRAAYTIIQGKGATYYGIGAGLARIVRAIARDERAVLSTSAETALLQAQPKVAYSVPRVVGRQGLLHDLMPTLDQSEARALAASVKMLAETAAKLT